MEIALLSAIVRRACESGKKEEDWEAGRWSIRRWQEQIERHLALRRCCVMGQLQQPSPKRGNVSLHSERHLRY